MNRRYVCKRGHSEYPVFITIYTNPSYLAVATSTDDLWVYLTDFLWLLYFLLSYFNFPHFAKISLTTIFREILMSGNLFLLFSSANPHSMELKKYEAEMSVFF